MKKQTAIKLKPNKTKEKNLSTDFRAIRILYIYIYIYISIND